MSNVAYRLPAINPPAPAVALVPAAPPARRRHRPHPVLELISGTKPIAVTLGVNPSTVRRWRAGSCRPRFRHYRQLAALWTLLEGATRP